MTLRLIPLTILAMIIVAFQTTTESQATTPPESRALITEDEVENRVAEQLAEWLQKYAVKDDVLALSGVEFTSAAKEFKGYKRAYIELAHANRKESKENSQKTFTRVKEYLEQQNLSEKPKSARHPVLPFLFLEMSRVEDLDEKELGYAMAGLVEYGAGTCAQKQLIFDGLQKEKIGSLDEAGIQKLWERIATFRSTQYKRNALRKILDAIPNVKRKQMRGQILSMIEGHKSVVSEREWLKDWVEKAEYSVLKGRGKNFYDAKREARKRRCSTAKSHFLTGLASGTAVGDLEDTLEVGKKIGTCYRRRGSAARRSFWSNITKPMEKAYGFRGWAEAQLRLGYLHWTVDNFVEAKRHFQAVRTQGSSIKDELIEGKAIFALARVAENEGEFDLAVSHFKDYVTRFPSGENYQDGLRALVLLHIDKRSWQKALPPLEKIIADQSQLSVDDRSTGTLAFSLYWAGRIYYELGNKTGAAEMWRRGASEFYSTFYGAISHYLHEQITGQRFALAPSRTDEFRIHKYRKHFEPSDRRRVRRIQALAEMGARDEALCEIAELDLVDKKPEKVLLKSLFLHAVGDWLEAIKTYDSLPRSFRHALPGGFERILYPRRYTEEVHSYAKKAGVDPDLVLAIIRQESVFNPKAYSPAGARGLMQLMPATARLESRRLKKGYLPLADRQRIKRLARRKQNLFTADLNVALGVHHFKTLITKYKHPVFALCAYNASPSAANRWRAAIPSDDILAFVERIPYKETRGYVKLILRNYFYYKRWYKDEKNNLEHLDAVTGALVAMTPEEQEKIPRH